MYTRLQWKLLFLAIAKTIFFIRKFESHYLNEFFHYYLKNISTVNLSMTKYTISSIPDTVVYTNPIRPASTSGGYPGIIQMQWAGRRDAGRHQSLEYANQTVLLKNYHIYFVIKNFKSLLFWYKKQLFPLSLMTWGLPWNKVTLSLHRAEVKKGRGRAQLFRLKLEAWEGSP